mmetsp:Transcript_15520/g.28190  ORF Transcript_15520/g.28190 Transcript_15520/m.28190 type:complete len:236 (+) Transcript_15520:91-798(+)
MINRSILQGRSILHLTKSLGRRTRVCEGNSWFCSVGLGKDGMTERTRRLAEELLSESSSEERRRSALARAITLVESRAPTHRAQADLLLNHALCHKVSSSNPTTSFRLGIAGPPGAGKSTFIEALGLHILNAPEGGRVNHKLAVACIDPSSTVTGGSILGDKTRMMELSRHERAYVRPSPNSGTLGGLSAYTADVVNLFEVCSAHSKTILHEAEQRVVVEKGRMGCSPYLGSLLS